jgi:phosphate-selective porin OprO/OprP
MRRLGLILLLTVLFGGGSLQAQADGAASVLIRDVRLIDREGEVEDVVANILIKKGRLDLVTKDRIPSSEADLTLDAKEGILLGKLELGEPASFVVLDEDPRENVEILLDTATHIHFAVVKGEIVRNNLSPVTETEEEIEKRGWLAYTPPPIALPLSYQDKKRWNRFETKPVSGLFLAGVVLDRQRWLSQDAESEEQVGDLDEFNRGEIRGFRFGFVGTFNFKRPWVYTLFAATNAFDKGFETEKDDDFTLFDYRLDIPLFEHTTVSIGKQKEPISMERLMGGPYLPIFERSSVSDTLLPARNVGIVFNGASPNGRFTWAVGGFNDWIDASQSFDESARQIVGRITGLPLVSADESNVLHLGLGVRYTDAKEGLRYRGDPEFNLSPDFVDTGTDDTGPMEANSSTTFDLEASWRRGPFWLHGEYLRNEVAAPDLGDPVFSGYHVTASWILSGEMRAYNRRSGVFGPVPVARSVYQGGWGAWELALRWTELDLTDAEIEGGEMQVLSAAVNWWLTSYFSFNFYYRRIELDRFGVQGTSDGMLARVVLMLE